MSLKRLGNDRTIFSIDDKNINLKTHILGFALYIIIFAICIPYLLVKHKYWSILSVYFPNLDLMASVLGYHGGPMNTNIWRYLYNPTTHTIAGYITSNIINYLALIGVTYIVAYFTFIKKNIYEGWGRAFIILPITYFIPSNIIIQLMNIIGRYLDQYTRNISIINYLIVIAVGFSIISLFILIEASLLHYIMPYIVKILEYIY